jgi:outer membrane protein OmpA-like peptidoglycan-associated protein
MKLAAARHIVLLAAAVIAGAAAAPAWAQSPSTSDIVNSLQPQVKFRSFDPNQAAKEKKQADLVNHLQNAKTRQITVEERQEITDVVEQNALPAIDLEVFFNFDSAEITPEALPILKKLGAALSDEKLKGSVFLVAGHTDAKGPDAYNLTLSDQRAKAVAGFLVENFHIDPKQLVAVGFGEEKLKNPKDPLAAENRRVQVVNMANKDVAARASAPAPDGPPPAGKQPQ